MGLLLTSQTIKLQSNQKGKGDTGGVNRSYHAKNLNAEGENFMQKDKELHLFGD